MSCHEEDADLCEPHLCSGCATFFVSLLLTYNKFDCISLVKRACMRTTQPHVKDFGTPVLALVEGLKIF